MKLALPPPGGCQWDLPWPSPAGDSTERTNPQLRTAGDVPKGQTPRILFCFTKLKKKPKCGFCHCGSWDLVFHWQSGPCKALPPESPDRPSPRPFGLAACDSPSRAGSELPATTVLTGRRGASRWGLKVPLAVPVVPFPVGSLSSIVEVASTKKSVRVSA